jgi:glycine oxidase
VVVVGGGIVGLACADELVRAGHDVRLFDPAPASGATYAAAGMLAPGGEAWFGEEALLRLGLDSLGRWPAYAAALEERSGHQLDLRAAGTLLVAADRDDLAELRRSCALLEASGVRVEELDRRALRAHEPTLSARVAGGALLPDDCHVHPRRVAEALLSVLGERVVRAPATVAPDGVLLDDGSRITADVVVLATGAVGMPHVRPVRGEVARVRSQDAPTRVLRARVHGDRVYVVPRAGGELVVGATEEEHPAGEGAPLPTVGGIARLLDTARILVPGLDTAELLEVVARDRPGSPDNGPLLGSVAAPGPARVLLAGGHHRGGVLLAPVTAAALRAHVDGVDVPEAARPFTPDRFETQLHTRCSERDEDPCD